ncbi:MAG: hypothetical protein WD690_13970 [Vicinamibacterales bacterium]
MLVILRLAATHEDGATVRDLMASESTLASSVSRCLRRLARREAVVLHRPAVLGCRARRRYTRWVSITPSGRALLASLEFGQFGTALGTELTARSESR